MRVQKASKLANDDLSFLQDPDLRLAAWKYNQRFVRRTTIHLGVRYLFRQQSDRAIVKVDNRSLDGLPKPSTFTAQFDIHSPTLAANLESNVDISVFYKLNNKWQIGAGGNFRQYIPRNYVTGAYISTTQPSLTESYFNKKNEFQNKLNFYVVVSHRYATLITKHNNFSTQVLAGIDFNRNDRITWRSLYFWSDNFTLASENFNYAFSTGNFEGTLHSNPQTGECTVYIDYPSISNSGMDGLIGLRLKWQRFTKISNLGFFCDAFRRIYIFQPKRGRSQYNLADVLHDDLNRNNHGLSPTSVVSLKTYFTNNFNLDITLDESRRQFLSRFSLNAGVYYQFQ
ncbi:MAG: hypothetical protein JNJ57_20380 [Saprospiraceae bacterium]|nr:hypothetical protein [Saprospiraceae bacterium]